MGPLAGASADTVVVTKSNGELQCDATRFLSPLQPNVLRVFDGNPVEQGLRYGDGKLPHAYVGNWTKPSRTVAWRVRLNKKQSFDAAVRYTTADLTCCRSYQIVADRQQLSSTAQPTQNVNTSKTVTIGRLTLGPGEQNITVKPVKIEGAELMRLFEITLTPAAV